MKLKRIIAWMVVGLGLLTIGCSNEFVEPTLGEGYGYVQFKLYKAASYQPAAQAKTRAAEIVDQLDLLSQAHKVQVTLLFEVPGVQGSALENRSAGGGVGPNGFAEERIP